ncbi:MAG: isovaleryl-CoA dehydrogenase [Betaproteobacteria bacterium]|nr:isovaleryl-CoA dehydrogenase [Betaproteobacteria bacterium]
MSSRDRFITHEVTNQAPPLTPYDAYATDVPLQQALVREGAAWALPAVQAYGPIAGGELMELGFAANENKPVFKPFDRYGNRLDDVEFHPAYHRLMELGIAHGVPNFAWRHADTAGAHVARAGLMYLHGQAEQGTCCPLTMTYASVPVFAHAPVLAKEWLPRINAIDYDNRSLPAWKKRGNVIGMGMTEKQGGSDVRLNTTRAFPLSAGGTNALYELVGHKFFLSAPMCDAFLVLAQAERGLSCFLLPRFAPDGGNDGNGKRNGIRVQRLKNKLGDWSNASSEVEFHGATGWLVGEEGRGVATILEMVALTRQDCMIGSAAIMRQALVQAIHHAHYRAAFGKLLIDQPLMKNVLADLALESEAALALTMRVARAVDASGRDAREAAFARIATAIGKYWVCKRCTPFVNEAQECLGGAGYVEESILARLLRQAPLNSIWEGSGNIQCLDVLRALNREPETRDALFAEFALVKGANRLLDQHVARLAADLDIKDNIELRSRALVEAMAVGLQAVQLLRMAESNVGEEFCAARLGEHLSRNFGTLHPSATFDALIGRALPNFAGRAVP